MNKCSWKRPLVNIERSSTDYINSVLKKTLALSPSMMSYVGSRNTVLLIHTNESFIEAHIIF